MNFSSHLSGSNIANASGGARLAGALAVLLWFSVPVVAAPMGTAFTYQGRLADGGSPANGTYDLRFAVYDASSGGAQLASTIITTPVSNGLFTVTLDFGPNLFTGAARWISIAVRPNSMSPFVPLTPLQPVLPVPYAIMANSASNLVGTLPASQLSGTLPSDQLAGTYSGAVTFENASGNFLGSISGNGMGLTDLDASQLAVGTVPDARLSSRVPLRDVVNLFTATNTFAGVANLTNVNNAFRGSFTGNGAGMTNLNATNLIGTIALARLPAAVITNNQTGVTLNGTFSGNGSGLTGLPSGFTWQVVAGTFQQAQPNNGYVAADPGLVIIALPTSPPAGSVVRVSGAGTGGWRVSQNAGQSILAGNLGVVGTGWTPRESTRNWHCVASSSDGTKLVAGADGGQVFTSTDSGATWTPRDFNRAWYTVASSSDGTKLVAGVNNGQLYTSTTSGTSWTARDSNRQWSGVASSADGTKLVAVVLNGQIYTSTSSGTSWTPRDSNRQWSAAASSSDGTRLVAVVNGGFIYTSADSGASWFPHGSSSTWSAVASSADGAKLVAAVSGGQIYTSSDYGTNWTAHEITRTWSSVASSSDGTKLVALANGGQIYVSSDSGVSWSARESNRTWSTAASSADGTKLVAVVNNGQIFTSNPATTTAGSAGYLAGGQYSAIELQYIGNGQFLPLSHEGAFSVY